MTGSTEITARRVAAGFDHHDPEFAADPYPTYAALRSDPVTWIDAYGGYWLVTGYDEVRKASQDDATFLSGGDGVAIPPLSPIRNPPIEFDGPQVQKWRRVLLGEMSPAAAKRNEPAIRAMATECINAFIESSTADLVPQLTTPLPARMIMNWLGLDETQWEAFVETVHTLLHSAAEPERTMPAVAQLFTWIDEAISERTENGLRDDAISRLIEGVDPEEVPAFAFTLIVAGLDTTSAGLGNALVTLGRDTALREQLVTDPALLPKAVEELLRHESPLQLLARTAACDTQLGGKSIAEGDRLLLSWAAANRDPARFSSPDRVDLSRPTAPHVAFGVGLHRCLGSNIARTTMRIGIEEVLRRLPDYEIVDEVARYPDAALIYAPTSIRVRFTPQAQVPA